MKNTKKLLALVLAMVMAFSLMAVTAAAYGAEEHEHVCSTETIQPRQPTDLCPECARPMTNLGTHLDANGDRYTNLQCQNAGCTYREILRYYW